MINIECMYFQPQGTLNDMRKVLVHCLALNYPINNIHSVVKWFSVSSY